MLEYLPIFATGLLVGTGISIIIGEWLARQSHNQWIKTIEETQSAYFKLKNAHEKEVWFYKYRCELLQKAQSQFRDPERQITCNILANASPHSLGWKDSKDEQT